MNVHDFQHWKKEKQKISMLTCYDYWTAAIVNRSSVNALLVGDSAAMVMHGETSTLPATVEMMAYHTQAVRKGAPDKFIVGDLPFLSYRGSRDHCLKNIDAIMKAGANAVKLEGILGNEDLIALLVQSGVPVMAHLGLTPQSVHGMGGYHVQGKAPDHADQIHTQAKIAQDLGCFSLVLECVPTQLGETISKQLEIPTIGIGAGPFTDGQILVMQDMLGAFEKNAKFVRTYKKLFQELKGAFDEFDADVKSSSYPNLEESYS